VYVTLENPWYSIQKQSHNAYWVKLAFGQSGFDELKGTASRAPHTAAVGRDGIISSST
jgi:hypothetical protein